MHKKHAVTAHVLHPHFKSCTFSPTPGTAGRAALLAIPRSPSTVPDCCRHELGPRAPEAILGHSLGGKVTLGVLARLAEEGAPLPKQVRHLCSWLPGRDCKCQMCCLMQGS